MSRSRKKNPITGTTTARSEKHDKRIMNGKLRQKAKGMLKRIYGDGGLISYELADEYIEPLKDEVMNKWSMAKDGKTRWDKNSDYYKKALRK